MSNSNQDRLIGRFVWGSSVVLSLKLKKAPLSLAHRLFGPRFSITEVIGFCNGNHIAERILTRVLHALNNLARTAGIEAASLKDMKCGIPIGGKVGWDFTPPPPNNTPNTATGRMDRFHSAKATPAGSARRIFP